MPFKGRLASWALLIGVVAMAEADPNTEQETFSLIVSEGPISALLGSSITLPCSVDPQFSVVSLKTTWYRPTKLNTPILQYENQKVQTDPSDAQYRGRVSLVGQLDQGNVSIRLEKLTLEDRGEYVCYVQSNVWYEEATMSLVVEAVGSIPKLSSSRVEGKQVNVSCVSDGWSPQPTVTWTGGGGEKINGGNTVYSTDDQGLVRVTSWLLRSPSESESLTCSVGLSDQKKREGTILVHRVFSLDFPKGPISAPLGSSITLPCSVSPQFSVASHIIRWYRPNRFDTPVLFYKEGAVQKDPSDVRYRGRVSLVGQLDQGNVSIRLEKLTLADRGEYVCYVGNEEGYEEARVPVDVEVAGTLSFISVTKAEGKQVNVTCVSDGWSPQPTVTWTDGGGQKINGENTVYSADEQGLVRVSSWLLHTPSESESLSCSVGLSDQERREGKVVPYVYTSDKGSTGAVVGAVICALVAFILLLIIVALLLYKKGLLNSRKKEDQGQQEKGTNEMNRTTTSDDKEKGPSETDGLLNDQKNINEDLQKKIEGLEKDVASKALEIQSLQQKNKELESQVTELQNNLADKTCEAATFATEKAGLQKNLDLKTSEAATLVTQNTGLQRELKDKTSEADRLAVEKAALQKDPADKTSEAATLATQKADLETQLKQKTEEATKLVKEKTALQEDVRSKDGVIQTLEKEKQALKSQVADKTHDTQALQQLRQGLQKSLDAKTSEAAALMKEKAGLQKDLADKTSEAERLAKERAELQTERETRTGLRKKREDLERELEKEKTEKTALEDKLKRLQNQLKDATERHKKLEETVAEKDLQLKPEQNKDKAIMDRLADMGRALDDITADLVAHKIGELRKLRDQIAAEQNKLMTAVGSIHSKIALKTHLDGHRKELEGKLETFIAEATTMKEQLHSSQPSQ